MCLCSVIFINVEYSKEIFVRSFIDFIYYWGLVFFEWVDGVWIGELIQGSIYQLVIGCIVYGFYSFCIIKIEYFLRDGNICVFKFVYLYDYMYLVVSIFLIY